MNARTEAEQIKRWHSIQNLVQQSRAEHERVCALAKSHRPGCVAARRALKKASTFNGLDAKPYAIIEGRAYGWWMGEPCLLFGHDKPESRA